MSKKDKKAHDEPIPPPPFDPSCFVVLRSYDGHRVFLDRNLCRISRVLKKLLNAAANNVIGQGEERLFPATEFEITSERIGGTDVPLVHAHCFTGDQLELAARFMAYKYKNDHEGEKKPLPSCVETGAAIAVAVALQL
jgi:hypothetical protein